MVRQVIDNIARDRSGDARDSDPTERGFRHSYPFVESFSRMTRLKVAKSLYIPTASSGSTSTQNSSSNPDTRMRCCIESHLSRSSGRVASFTAFSGTCSSVANSSSIFFSTSVTSCLRLCFLDERADGPHIAEILWLDLIGRQIDAECLIHERQNFQDSE